MIERSPENRLNHQAQRLRIDAGELSTEGRRLEIGPCHLHAGDEIVTRRNHRRLHTDRGLMIRNRDHWIIDAVHRNGDLTVHGRSGTVRLPTDYVQSHVELAYAQTSHATQGRTVDRSILLLDGPADVRSVYVPMTRGRHHNDAYIVTPGEDTALDLFADAIARSWIDRPALARQAELAGHNRHRPGTLPPDELRALLDQQAQLTGTLGQLRSDSRLPRSTNGHATTWTRRSSGSTPPPPDSEPHTTSSPSTTGHFAAKVTRPRFATPQQAIESLPDQIRDHAATVETLTAKLDDIDRRWHRAEQLERRRPALETQQADMNARLDDDRRIRTRQIRRDPPSRITDTLGTRPPGGDPSRAWDRAAGPPRPTPDRLRAHRRPRPLHGHKLPIGFTFSRTLTSQDQRSLEQALMHQRQQVPEREGPALGIGRMKATSCARAGPRRPGSPTCAANSIVTARAVPAESRSQLPAVEDLISPAGIAIRTKYLCDGVRDG